MITVVALDPGKTTGIAIGTISENPHNDFPMRIEVTEDTLSCSGLWYLLQKERPQHIVCESFEFRQNKGTNVELYSRNLIGVAQLVSELHPFPKLHMQTASYGKGYYSDAKLKSEDAWVKGKKHGRDALRHLLAWYHFGHGYQFNKKGYEICNQVN